MKEPFKWYIEWSFLYQNNPFFIDHKINVLILRNLSLDKSDRVTLEVMDASNYPKNDNN